jgi:hypothetical protein
VTPFELADIRQRDHTDGRALKEEGYLLLDSEAVQAVQDRRNLLVECTRLREALQSITDLAEHNELDPYFDYENGKQAGFDEAANIAREALK